MNNNPSGQKKSNLLSAVLAFAVTLTLLIVVINRGLIYSWFASVIDVLNPVIIGFVLAYFCNPLYNLYLGKLFRKLRGKKLKKALSLIFTYITLFAVFAAIVTMIIPQVVESYKDLESKFSFYLNSAIEWGNNMFNSLPIFEGHYEDIFDFIDVNSLKDSLTDFLKSSGIKEIFSFVLNYGTGAITGTINIVADIVIGFCISVYVLIYKKHIASIFKRLLRSVCTREKYDSALRKISTSNDIFRSFFIGKLIDSLIVMLICLVVFTIFAIPYAPLVSVLVGITNVIPMIGPFIGGIPSAFIIFIVNPAKALVFIVLIVIIQQIDGNIIDPLISGSRTGLTALEVIIAVTIMGGIWGIPGMLLGVPLFAVLYEFMNEFVDDRLEKANDPEFPPQPLALSDADGNSKKVKLFDNFRDFYNKIKKKVKK